MKKRMIYRQCGLRQDLGNDRSYFQRSYIPEKFARLNQVVRLRNADDQWDDGWQVVSIGNSVAACELPDSHRQIKSHRQQTGDSLRR